jgi:hypothetical protein
MRVEGYQNRLTPQDVIVLVLWVPLSFSEVFTNEGNLENYLEIQTGEDLQVVLKSRISFGVSHFENRLRALCPNYTNRPNVRQLGHSFLVKLQS